MSLRGSITLDKNQKLVEMARNQATLKAGKKFITLQLIDHTKNRIQGAIVLNPIPYEDPETGLTQFHFEEKGGPIDFQLDEMNSGYFAKILDCPHNRDFLASMYDAGFWKIEDEQIEKEIAEKAERIKENMVKDKPAPKKDELEDMPDELLKQQQAKINKEVADRELKKATMTGRVPQPGVRGEQKKDEPEVDVTNSPETAKETKPEKEPEGTEEKGEKGKGNKTNTKKGGQGKSDLVDIEP